MPELDEKTADADVEATDTDVVADADAKPDDKGAEALGDKGKQALDRMKADRNAARDEAKAGREALAALQARIDGKEAEHAAEKTQADRDKAALAKADDRIRSAEVRRAATGKLANPMLALKLLDLSEFEVKDDGSVDDAAISAAIDALLEENPGLGAQGVKRFQGNPDGGTRKESRPTQLTESDLKSMSAKEINEARRSGRLDTILKR